MELKPLITLTINKKDVYVYETNLVDELEVKEGVLEFGFEDLYFLFLHDEYDQALPFVGLLLDYDPNSFEHKLIDEISDYLFYKLNYDNIDEIDSAPWEKKYRALATRKQLFQLFKHETQWNVLKVLKIVIKP